MGSAAPKPKPMRSRKSSIKTRKRIEQNQLVIKKIEKSLKNKK